MRKTLRKKKGQKYGKWNIKALEQFCHSIPGFNITPIETNHSISITHYSYLMTWHHKRIYFYGDTETTDIALTMTNLDWAFIPYWTAIQLNKQQATLDAKMLGVYHFYPEMLPTTSNPEKVKLLINQGDIITIPYEIQSH
jgi:L-ascorbate metabolism protein UlaG (beta-lactamase superfamily)